jgi:hypothetical protein
MDLIGQLNARLLMCQALYPMSLFSDGTSHKFDCQKFDCKGRSRKNNEDPTCLINVSTLGNEHQSKFQEILQL